MAKAWDNILKRMFTANPQHFLNWLTPGAVLLHERSSALKTRDLEADRLCDILWHETQMILHLEFQRRGDAEMGQRLWEYNASATINSGLTVYSVVIYLRKERKIVEPPYIRRLPDGEPLHIFAYKIIKLWEVPAEAFLQPGREGLLPLITLAHDGKRREVVNAMIERIIASNRIDLLTLAYNLAALVFDAPGEREWLIRRFEMYKKDLEDSWVYQGILQEGREQGIRQALIDFLEVRYPTLVDLAREQTSLIKDVNTLRQVVHKVYGLQTASEIEEYLLALSDDARKN